KPPVVGVLWHAGNAAEERPYLTALTAGLSDLGYQPGETIVLENRFPAEQDERFRSLAVDLANLRPNVVVAVTPKAALAMQQATKTIPIVFVLVADPISIKLADSWAKPGGNITGLSQLGIDLAAKRLELLKEAVPGISRVAFLMIAA